MLAPVSCVPHIQPRQHSKADKAFSKVPTGLSKLTSTHHLRHSMSDISKPSRPSRIGILIFPGWELLDATGPLECLNTLTHMGIPDLQLFTISASPGPVSTTLDLPDGPAPMFSQSLVADTSLADARALSPPLDLLIIPGGFGAFPRLPPAFTSPNAALQPYVDFVRHVFPSLRFLFTVCNGAGIAALAGVLDGVRATTNKMAWTAVTALGESTHWVGRARWVKSNRDGVEVWSTSGVSAGTDGMVALIASVWGDTVAETLCSRMEWERRVDAGNDPFGAENHCEDVLPKA